MKFTILVDAEENAYDLYAGSSDDSGMTDMHFHIGPDHPLHTRVADAFNTDKPLELDLSELEP